MTKQRQEVSEWRNMDRDDAIAKEWEAFDKAKGALVKAIRDTYGKDTPISFQRYSFGIIDQPVTTTNPLQGISLSQIEALLVAMKTQAATKASKGNGKHK